MSYARDNIGYYSRKIGIVNTFFHLWAKKCMGD